jgi:hypothetical protein
MKIDGSVALGRGRDQPGLGKPIVRRVQGDMISWELATVA